MNKEQYKQYIAILNEELVLAMGCTEPIAIAYAAAKAREVLGEMPEGILVRCSGNIIKNTRCVTVPNTGNLKGIEASAIIGVVGGNPSKELQVISEVTEAAIEETAQRLKEGYCKTELLESSSLLHIKIEVWHHNTRVSVEIKDAHTNISKITKNDEVLLEEEQSENKYLGIFTDRSILNVEDIFTFANTVALEEVKPLLEKQINCNIAIAEEGLKGNYGLGIGKVLLEAGDKTCWERKMKAYTAAASEARMSGSDLPVVTNSGSGNQGITSSIPIIIYAREKKISEEMMYRGLIFSNLMTIHQKTWIGRLSAFCGVVSASCASGAAITYMEKGSIEQINMTITNTLANVIGIVCDGAKASCGAKIASSLDGAIMGHHLGMKNCAYEPSTGIIKDDIEKTIAAVGRIGKQGMCQTDKEILNIMLGD